MEAEVEVDEVIDFMFLKNHDNKNIEMSVNGIEDTHDLFGFCLDIFCKGIVLLFASDGRVELENISIEQFNIIKQKMALAGIDVKLDIEPLTDKNNPLLTEKIITVYSPSENASLKNYSLHVFLENFLLVVSFELKRYNNNNINHNHI